MQEYRVVIRVTVRKRLDSIARYITKQTREEHALRYVKQLRMEMEELSYLASILPESNLKVAKRHNPRAKTMTTRNRKWCIIFHIEGEYVVVDNILPTCMVYN